MKAFYYHSLHPDSFVIEVFFCFRISVFFNEFSLTNIYQCVLIILSEIIPFIFLLKSPQKPINKAESLQS